MRYPIKSLIARSRLSLLAASALRPSTRRPAECWLRGRRVSRKLPRRWHRTLAPNLDQTLVRSRRHGHRGVSRSGQGDGGLHLYLHVNAAYAAGYTIRRAGLPPGCVACRGTATPWELGWCDGWRGVQDYAGRHALAAPAVPRLLPCRKRVPFHSGRHAVSWNRMHWLLMGKMIYATWCF